MNKQISEWRGFYAQASKGPRYPTEWVVRTLAGGRYPNLNLSRDRYVNSKILDMGCGDGRNIGLLADLGFQVYATEIDQGMVADPEFLARIDGIPVMCSVGTNSCLPYEDCTFDYVLASSSCYYLVGETKWCDVRREMARVLRPGGTFIANFPDRSRSQTLNDAVLMEDGSYLVTRDPQGLRNGIRFIAPASANECEEILKSEFRMMAAGFLDDDYYGYKVAMHITVSTRL